MTEYIITKTVQERMELGIITTGKIKKDRGYYIKFGIMLLDFGWKTLTLLLLLLLLSLRTTLLLLLSL